MVADRGERQRRQSWAMTNATLKQGQQDHDVLMANGQRYYHNNSSKRRRLVSRTEDQMNSERDQRNARFRQGQSGRTRHNADENDYLLDQHFYANPSNGRTSTISTAYSNNWENGTGQKVLSNIQAYDPNADVPGNWTQLQPINH